MKRVFFGVFVLSFLLSACGALAPAPQDTSRPIAAVASTAVLPLTPTAVQQTAAPSVASTPGPYYKYTIPYLRSRTYGGGQVQLVGNPSHFSNFTRHLVTYPSDGITIAGFMDVPNGLGPFPVVIAIHGYIEPLQYSTLDYTTRYADALAASGYLVLHPTMRNFPPSGKGDDLFRVGMSIDVLNLIAIVKATGGQTGALEAADPQRIGLWGHSMGGGIATRVLTVSSDVRAALLYSPVSGDELKNYAEMGIWSNNKRGNEERAVPPGEFPLISPMFFYQYVQAAVSIHQGLADTTVPVQWTRATCDQLQEMGKIIECHYYDGQGHTFSGNPDKSFMRAAAEFFDAYLRRP